MTIKVKKAPLAEMWKHARVIYDSTHLPVTNGPVIRVLSLDDDAWQKVYELMLSLAKEASTEYYNDLLTMAKLVMRGKEEPEFSDYLYALWSAGVQAVENPYLDEGDGDGAED